MKHTVAILCPVRTCNAPMTCLVDAGYRASRDEPGQDPGMEEIVESECACAESDIRRAAYMDAVAERAVDALSGVLRFEREDY